MNYCSKHDLTIDDDEACPVCADEVAEEHPDFASVIRRGRRWQSIYAAYTIIVTGVIVLGYWIFLAVREWVIWNR